MSRFENLEFGEGKPRPLKGEAEGTPVRSAAYFLEQAEGNYLAGDFETALRNYSRALEQDPAEYEGWFGQVRMLIELGEYEEALVWADKALELYPEHPDLLAAKSVASGRAGDPDKAMAYTDNAISQRGATAYVWLARAEALLDRGSATAAHCVSNAVAAAAGKPRVELEAGRTLLRAGRCGPALGYLRKAVAALPQSALAWLELGRCQAALGFPEAAMTLSQCLTLRPNWQAAGLALDRFQRRGVLGRVRGFLRRARRGKDADQ